MKRIIPVMAIGILVGSASFGQSRTSSGDAPLRVKVRDVTHEYYPSQVSLFPTPTPAPTSSIPGTKPGTTTPGGTPTNTTGTSTQNTSGNPMTDPLPPLPGGGTSGGLTGGSPTSSGNQVSLGDLITLGQKVWDFVISNKPNATFQSLKASVVPSGITSWTQLRGWSKPVSKIYRVEFTNMFGASAGSFDYRITFVSGGSYQGKGKYIGQISVVPSNIHLITDRSLEVRAELLEPLNFGTEENPVAGAELQITWSSPTTTRYQMNSAELFLYGTGEIQNLTDGN